MTRSTGGEADDIIYGGAGDDTLRAGIGSGDRDIIFGEDGNDTIYGGSAGNDLNGGAGSDTLIGTAVSNTNYGNIFNAGDNHTGEVDFVFGSANGEQVFIGFNDTVYGGGGADYVYLDLQGAGSGVVFDARALGTSGTSANGVGTISDVDGIRIYGTDGDDTLYLGDRARSASNSLHDGRDGNDLIYGGIKGDYVTGGNGSDELHGGGGDDWMFGGDYQPGDIDILHGDSGKDRLIDATIAFGGDGNDALYGHELHGGEGNDLVKARVHGTGTINLFGDGGDDRLLLDQALGAISADGGAGADRFELVWSDQHSANVIIIDGGDGYDTLDLLDLSSSAAGIEFDFGSWAGGTYGSVTVANIEAVETLIASDFDDSITGILQNVAGGAGNDMLSLSAITWQPAILKGGDGDDILIGNEFANTLSGEDGDDSLTGDAGDDTLDGGIGQDSLGGGSGNDVLYGGEGDDILTGGEGRDQLRGENGNDVIDARAGTEASAPSLIYVATIYGGAGNDTIKGSAFKDNIAGDDGNDSIRAYAGNDVIQGGTGLDAIYGDDGNDLILAGADDDYANGNAGDDLVQGDGGNDTVKGGAGADQLFGNDGDDRLSGDLGRDVLTGGAGIDAFVYDRSDDSTLAEMDLIQDFTSGTDRLDLAELAVRSYSYTVSGGNYFYQFVLVGGGVLALESVNFIASADIDFAFPPTAENDVLTGGALADTIYGLGGDDVISGKAGLDTAFGGDGNDTLYAEIADGGAGDDIIRSVDTAHGGDGNDSIIALAAQSADLFGEDGNDYLEGGDVNDRIDGGAGNDVLRGGVGRDTTTGGAGADTFRFNSLSELSGNTAQTADIISDFSHAEGDRIVLNAIDAITGGADDRFSFIGAAGFSGTAGELRFHQTAAKTYVSGDVDGDGTADFMIRLDGLHTLVAGDFVL
jgi:Ca2+-binding RTX toxin-like protein